MLVSSPAYAEVPEDYSTVRKIGERYIATYAAVARDLNNAEIKLDQHRAWLAQQSAEHRTARNYEMADSLEKEIRMTDKLIRTLHFQVGVYIGIIKDTKQQLEIADDLLGE